MKDKVKELEEQLAKARSEKVKKTGFTIVVFEDNLEDLKEINVMLHDLTEKDKAQIMKAAGDLGDNMQEIKEIAENLDTTVGPWLKLMALMEDPIKEIIGCMFKLDTAIVATLPNIDLLSFIFKDNPWINSKAKGLASELDFIAKKNSSVVANDDGREDTWQHRE